MTVPATRLLLDEMIGGAVARQLRALGLDVESVVELADLRALPDEAIMEMGSADQRVVITRNLQDFVPIAEAWAAAGRVPAGLVLVSESAFPQSRNLVGALVSALAAAAAAGALPRPGEMLWLKAAPAG